jgi:hypothetical protein
VGGLAGVTDVGFASVGPSNKIVAPRDDVERQQLESDDS